MRGTAMQTRASLQNLRAGLRAVVLLSVLVHEPVAAVQLDAHGNVIADGDGDSPAGQLYAERCASCHDHPQGRVPPRSSLRYTPPENVLHALREGPMRLMAEGLSDEQIRSLVVLLTGREAEATADPMANACTTPVDQVVLDPADWKSIQADPRNIRYRADAGIDAASVPTLRLKWSFAYPGRASGPVSLAGNRVYLSSSSHVVSLDAASGCTRWAYPVTGRIVRAVTLAALATPEGTQRVLALFGDDTSTLTALDATTGERVWATRVEEHVLSRITSAPSVHAARVYVPISGIEDPLTHDPQYACCTSRGGVAALDLASGRIVWKQYHIAQEPALRSAPDARPQQFGPAGASTYTPLAIDPRRGLVYASTAEEYGFLNPQGPYSVIAYDLATGERRWQRQFLPAAGAAREAACAAQVETDCRNVFSMGTSVSILQLAGGREVLAVGQKWGWVYGLDPDRDGEELWRTRVGLGGDLGGVMYGMAFDGNALYVPVSDDEVRPPHRPGGLAALDPASGAVLWRVAGPDPQCAWGSEPCLAAFVAAPSAVPGAVFAGAWDGHLRIYASDDGKLIRDIDTGGEFAAVGGLKARGGQVSGYPVVIGKGAIYVTSGASSILRPGNALLVYAP